MLQAEGMAGAKPRGMTLLGGVTVGPWNSSLLSPALNTLDRY